MTTTMQHPAFDDVTVTIEDDKVEEHIEAGWLKADADKQPVKLTGKALADALEAANLGDFQGTADEKRAALGAL